jgi:hypothetical protein
MKIAPKTKTPRQNRAIPEKRPDPTPQHPPPEKNCDGVKTRTETPKAL